MCGSRSAASTPPWSRLVRCSLVPGLDASVRHPVALEGLLAEVRPDLLHLQNVMNPEALEQVASRQLPAVVTVQDHRVFCPGRGKWRADGAVCREPMGRARCAGCFDDVRYFDRIFALTEERLAVIRGIACVVLSRYMAGELAAVGVPAEQIRIVPPFMHGLSVLEPDGPPCVLFSGRLVPAKGVQDAVEVWQRARPSLPLAIAGAGPERARLPAVDGLELAGWVPRPGSAAAGARARAAATEPLAGTLRHRGGRGYGAWRSGSRLAQRRRR